MGTALTMWESRISRKTEGPTNRNGYWRTKMQQGTCNTFKSPEIETVTI
jgi:hypothetical protein